MITLVTLDSKKYQANLHDPIDLAIPLVPDGENPNCYYADNIASEVIRAGDFVGSVREGGSVNHKKLTLIPHGNGTHTECYGHIAQEATPLSTCLSRFHFTAYLISVTPDELDGDRIVSLEKIKTKLPNLPIEAVIIRTLPNDDSKKIRQYSGTNPPYFDPGVMEYLVSRNVLHVLTDLPSVDREADNGKLLAHKAFWQFPKQIRKESTITELIYVPSETADGLFLLNLQITSLAMDASPSKPVLYKLTEVS